MATDLAIERPVALPTAAPVATPAACPQSLADRAAADGVRFILATFVDLNGEPCSKLVPVQAADQLQADGVGFAGYAAGATGQVPSDPDLMAVPDLASYAPLPFVRPGLAMVQCDPHVEGEPWLFAPRVILRRMIERAAQQSVELWTGAEVEYFLVARDGDGRVRVADELDRAAQPCYDARGVTRMFEHLAAVSEAMNSLGWGNYANDHEDGNGQLEQNFGFSDVLTTADRVITARYVIQMLAEQRGMAPTFMPKPFTDRTGNGMHRHLSLWRDGAPFFPAADDARGLGLSPMAYGFLGGVLDHAAGLSALLARFPALPDAGVSSSYAGCYDVAPDFNPILSATPYDGLFLATGFSGHGYKISPASGLPQRQKSGRWSVSSQCACGSTGTPPG